MSLIKFFENVNLTGYTLVIPSVSVANIPQLTVDLLISNFHLQRVGMIWHPAIVPSVGSNPFLGGSTDLCTACEFYINEELKVAAIQIRSGLEYEMVTMFIDELKAELTEHKYNKIVVLSSSFDYELFTLDIGKMFYISTLGKEERLEKEGVLPLKPIDGEYIINGGGYGTILYKSLKDICHTTLIMRYSSEGDNRNDATDLLGAVHSLDDGLGTIPLLMVCFPSSWSHLFGGPPPEGIY